MKKQNVLLIPVDEELLAEIMSLDERRIFQKHEEEQTGLYIMPAITKDQWRLQDEKTVYGNGVVWLDPFFTTKEFVKVYKTADLEINPLTRTVQKGNVKLKVRETEFELLLCFLRNPKMTLTRPVLLQNLELVTNHYVQDNTLTVHISRLKKVLGKINGRGYIKTHPKIGYSWVFEVTKIV